MTDTFDEFIRPVRDLWNRADLLATGLSLANAEKDALQAENAALRARLDEQTPPLVDPPPPPPPKAAWPMLMGATIDKRNGQTQAQAEAAFPRPLDLRRVFTPGPPTTSNVAANLSTDDAARRSVILSYKGDGSDQVLNSIRVLDRRAYLVKWHEPENDGGTHTASWFRGQTEAHIAQVNRLRAAGRNDLIPAFVLMTWLDRDPNASTTSADWFPSGPLDDVVLLLDPYDDVVGKPQSLQSLVTPTLNLWRKAGGKRWGIAEVGTKTTGAAAKAWLDAAVTWAEGEGAEVFCYFHSAVGKKGPWWMDDPGLRAAWSAYA